jgi:hypothetical protein
MSARSIDVARNMLLTKTARASGVNALKAMNLRLEKAVLTARDGQNRFPGRSELV